MTERNVFQEVANNYRTLIGKRYSKAVLTKVWKEVSHFIRRHLQQGKGVTIKNLGTFTFSEWTLYTGNKSILNKQPIFVISEKLVQFYNLKTRLLYTSGKIPIYILNHVNIACSLGVCRQLVEDCVTETTEAFLRLLSQNQDVEIPFPGVGNLSVKNKQVQMTFHDNFLEDSESSYCNIVSTVGDDFKSDPPRYTSSPLPSNEVPVPKDTSSNKAE